MIPPDAPALLALYRAVDALRALYPPPDAEGVSAGSGESPPADDPIYDELLRDEGFVRHAYQDSLGYWTIGIGRLIDRRRGGGITREEAKYLLRNDVAETVAELDEKLPWWRGLDPVRQRVILNMAFNLGVAELSTWKRTLGSVQAGRYEDAAREMLQSQPWASQVKGRAVRLAAMMRTGKA